MARSVSKATVLKKSGSFARTQRRLSRTRTMLKARSISNARRLNAPSIRMRLKAVTSNKQLTIDASRMPDFDQALLLGHRPLSIVLHYRLMELISV
jgi:hypothetical protein